MGQTKYENGTTAVENPELSTDNAKKFKEIENVSMRAELKHIDKKTSAQGQTYYSETVEEVIPEQVDWWSRFALCLVRHMGGDQKRIVLKTSLKVNSQYLKDVLSKTIGSYPGISFATKEITINKPYHSLFHYRHELEEARKELEDDSEERQHLDLLLNFIYEEFKDVIEETENLLEQGMISFQHLWTIFKPGSTIYAPVFGQSRAFSLLSYQYKTEPPGLLLKMNYVDFDGDDMGTREISRIVTEFPGAETVNELSAYPTEWHANREEVEEQLIERGRRWEQRAGMHFANYEGIALEYTKQEIGRFNIDGRVVVDTKTYHRLNPNEAFSVHAFKSDQDKRSRRHRIKDEHNKHNATPDLVPEEKLQPDALDSKQCMLASSTVRGFSFNDKRWLEFFVDKLSPIDWNTDCFDGLVLPAAQKEIVKALVATHIQQGLEFDDFVKGKGKGLILVLHGPPGVGKTLTAETVAEYCKRPLYMVSSGDLGTDSSTLDQSLSRILDAATTWKAVLLIDEADVFLERRSLHDMQRNTLVSIFLRVLEYYKGILILTSNRVNTFDDAFKSRIHVPLKYSDLTVSSRKQVWKNFLGGMEEGAVEMDEKEYESLALANINGRQIKNVVRTAKSLAHFHGQPLNRALLGQVVQIQQEFDLELDPTNE